MSNELKLIIQHYNRGCTSVHPFYLLNHLCLFSVFSEPLYLCVKHCSEANNLFPHSFCTNRIIALLFSVLSKFAV